MNQSIIAVDLRAPLRSSYATVLEEIRRLEQSIDDRERYLAALTCQNAAVETLKGIRASGC